MKNRHLSWYIFLFFVGISVLSVTVTAILVSRHMTGLQLDAMREDLKKKSLRMADRFVPVLVAGDFDAVDALSKEVAALVQARVSVVSRDGLVVGDSQVERTLLGDFSERPEIVMSLADHIGMDIRQSRVLNDHMLYLSVPLSDQGRVVGALRLAVSISDMDDARMAAYRIASLAGLAIAIFTAFFGLLLSQAMGKSLSTIQAEANAWARGQPIPPPNAAGFSRIREIADLSAAVHHMAERMTDRIEMAMRRRNEIEAVLTSMTEGVLAIDAEETLIINNLAVCRILDRNACDFVGQKLHNVLRDTRFRRFVDRAVASDSAICADIEMTFNTEKVLRCHGTTLKDANGRNVGTVFVLNDVTQLKLLENIRKDFAVNVSHEIKTPLTAIKGFVETLIEMGGHEKDSAYFLTIIEKNVRRLERIIEDLVDLSRIENDEDRSQISLSEGPVVPVVERAMAFVAEKAREKNICVESVCDPKIAAAINPQLLERALVNLIQNAVAYSDRGKRVEITAGREGQRLAIRVKDHGVGIAKKHQSRIFERFYRVDEARSRDTGGTGLGLALVKHIVKIHRGEIFLKSELGKGSEFTIRLPLAASGPV